MNHCAAKYLTVAIGCQIDHAQINTQRAAIGFWLFWRFTALGDVQIVDALPPHQICATDLPNGVYQHLVLARTQKQAANNTAIRV